jgi:hypothetical protein
MSCPKYDRTTKKGENVIKKILTIMAIALLLPASVFANGGAQSEWHVQAMETETYFIATQGKVPSY